MSQRWQLDKDKKHLKHTSGLTIEFRGLPGSAHFEGIPSNIPQDMTMLDVARLVRSGFDFYRIQALKRNRLMPIKMKIE